MMTDALIKAGRPDTSSYARATLADSIPLEIFRTRTDRPWDPLLYKGYRVIPGG